MKQVNEIIDQLVAVVAQEAEHCERILTLLRQQQRHLVESDTAGIDANIQAQEEAIRRSRDLERRRLSLLDRLAEHPQFGGERPDMERLIQSLSDSYGRRLTRLRDALADAIDRIRRTKEQNAVLIDRSLHNIGETMRLLASVPGNGGATIAGINAKPTAAPVRVNHVG